VFDVLRHKDIRMRFIIVHEQDSIRARFETVIIAAPKIQTVPQHSGVAGQGYCRDNVSHLVEGSRVPDERPMHRESNVKVERHAAAHIQPKQACRAAEQRKTSGIDGARLALCPSRSDPTPVRVHASPLNSN
jgi:hypothetical protein